MKVVVAIAAALFLAAQAQAQDQAQAQTQVSPESQRQPAAQPPRTTGPSGALQQKIAPGLATFTDEVLFGHDGGGPSCRLGTAAWSRSRC